MKRPTEKPPRGQKNTHLIVLAAVAAFVALLLFLDAFVPIIPDGREHPAGGEEHAEETEKHWWQNVFDRNEPDEPDDPTETKLRPENSEYNEFIPRPTPTVEPVYYTDEEMSDAWTKILTKSLRILSEMEMAGEILPINSVGLFNVDLMGPPEIIVKSHTDSNLFLYTVYDVYMYDTVASWTGGTKNWESLCLWKERDAASSYSVLFEHQGDGDDEYVYEFIPSRLDLRELRVEDTSGRKTTYWLDAYQVDADEYEATRDKFYTVYERLDDTAVRFVSWRSMDGESVARDMLSQGQKFLRTDATEQ